MWSRRPDLNRRPAVYETEPGGFSTVLHGAIPTDTESEKTRSSIDDSAPLDLLSNDLDSYRLILV